MLALGPSHASQPFQTAPTLHSEVWVAQAGDPAQQQYQQQQTAVGMQTPLRGPGRDQGPRPQRLQQHPPSSQQQQAAGPQIYQRQQYSSQPQPHQLHLQQQACRQQQPQSQPQSQPQLQYHQDSSSQQQQPQPQQQPPYRPRRQSQQAHLQLPQLDEEEQELLRQLEDDIAAQPAIPPSTAASAGAPAAGGVGRAPPRPWCNRLMAVAAFRAEPDQRRRLEEDILAVAASACSETGPAGLAAGLGQGPAGAAAASAAAAQYRRYTQAGPVGSPSMAAAAAAAVADSKSRSAPGSMIGRGGILLTAEEEDYMDSIMLGGKGAGA